uniref:Uncharacterized protein n=1 Tax=Sphaerodactylus townsendi TaxID=933632 RepID=A0ACB8EKU5_9SAUR
MCSSAAWLSHMHSAELLNRPISRSLECSNGGVKFTTDVNATAAVSDVGLLPVPLLPSHSNENEPES